MGIFKNASMYLVGAIVSKTSKTRDTWRIKQSMELNSLFHLLKCARWPFYVHLMNFT